MKKIYLGLVVLVLLSVTPASAATTAKPVVYKPLTPAAYTPITWAKAPGINSYFQAPEGGGAIDFLTRIYLPQNQINFLTATATPINQTITVIDSEIPVVADTSTVSTDIANYPSLAFKRLGAETAKNLTPNTKFLWDAPFFNMQPEFTDLSMALKYTNGTSTTITGGVRSLADLAHPRKMLVVNNQTGLATIKDFDSEYFLDSTNGDLAIEGFAPTVAKSDNTSGAASRLFIGISNDGKELMVYCSQLATVGEASAALELAGASVDSQIQVDGGGSAACGYNLPGQYFVEPTRTLPLLMGAETILLRGTITLKNTKVRNGATAKATVTSQLAKGVTVRVYEEKTGYYRIGDKQWVLKTAVKKN